MGDVRKRLAALSGNKTAANAASRAAENELYETGKTTVRGKEYSQTTEKKAAPPKRTAKPLATRNQIPSYAAASGVKSDMEEFRRYQQGLQTATEKKAAPLATMTIGGREYKTARGFVPDARLSNPLATKNQIPSYAAASDIKPDSEEFRRYQQGMQMAIDKKEERKGAPWWEDAFAKDRTYIDLAKKGDLSGAAANLVGTGLQGVQSFYLNGINAVDALAHGEKPAFHYNMDKNQYDHLVVGRRGGNQTLGDIIGEKTKLGEFVYTVLNEGLSDPTNFVGGGMVYDAAKARGLKQVGSQGYAKALQNGTMAQVPRGSLDAPPSQNTAQEAGKLDELPIIQPSESVPKIVPESVKTAKVSAIDGLAAARNEAEAALEDARAGYRQYYAEYRSTENGTRRAGLLDDAEAAKIKMNAAQQELDSITKQLEDQTARDAARNAALATTQAKRTVEEERLGRVLKIAEGMDVKTVQKEDLDALAEISQHPTIAAMQAAMQKVESAKASASTLQKELDSAESLNDALRIREKLVTTENVLDKYARKLDDARAQFVGATQSAAAKGISAEKGAERLEEFPTLRKGQPESVDLSFKPGDRVRAADRNNMGVIDRANADSTFDVTFRNEGSKSTKTVSLDGDVLQRIDDAPAKTSPPEDMPEFASSEYRPPSAEEKKRVAAKNKDEKSPMELKEPKEFTEGIETENPEALGMLTESDCIRMNNPKGAYSKDLSRVLDSVSGKDTKLREVLRRVIERPVMDAKSSYAHGVKNTLDQYYEATKELGIKPGSKESAAVQWLGEGYRRAKNGEAIPYTLADLQTQFPDTWQNMQKMDGLNRRMYNRYLERLNTALTKIYPNVEKNATEQLTLLKAQRDGLQGKLKTLEGGLDAAPNSANYAEQLSNFAKRVRESDDKIIALQRDIESGEIFRGKRVQPRKDYYHHWQEMDDGFSAVKNIFAHSADIDPRLVGVSDWTKPKTKWAGFMQKRDTIESAEDSVNGMIKYVQAAEYKINIDPEIARMRGIVRDLQNGTVETRNTNGFIEWLTDYANDLAGKTNPFDRGFQKTLIGRKAMQGMRWLNNRFKGNAVVGNLSSVVSQVYNLPNAVGYIKNPRDVIQGFADAARVSVGEKKLMNQLSQSGFLTERYLDHAVSQFDESMLKTPERCASWLMEIGDRKVAEAAWFGAYRQAGRKGLKNAVEYADDIVRRSVAGRGIGEVPLNQKSEIVKLVAPFQVEVNNAYQVLKEKVGKKDALGLIGIFGTTWVLNALRKNFVDGRQTGFDPIHTVQDVHGEIAKEETSGEALSTADKAIKYTTRLSGELLSNLPGGVPLVQLGIGEDASNNLFGEADPTRYGTGNIGLKGLVKPIGDYVSGKQADYIEPILNTVLPFGGAQVNRTRKAAEDLGYIPKLRMDKENGLTARTQPTAGAYTPDNTQLKYLIDDNDKGNTARALAFGTTATKEGKAYIADGAKPLSDKKTAEFNALLTLDLKPKIAYDTVREVGAMKTKKDASGKTTETEPEQARRYIMEMDLQPGIKEEIDRQLVAGTKPNESGELPRVADYSSSGALGAFIALPEATFDKAKDSFEQAGVAYDTFVKLYSGMARIDSDNEADMLGEEKVSDVKRDLLASFNLPEEQKTVLDDLLIAKRKPISLHDFSIRDMSDSAQKKYAKAQRAGFSVQEYAEAWRAIGGETKRDDRIAAVTNLGYPYTDAEFFVTLYTERTK